MATSDKILSLNMFLCAGLGGETEILRVFQIQLFSSPRRRGERAAVQKAWIFAEGTGNESSIWCFSKTVQRTGLGTAFVEDSFNPANRKNSVFQSKLPHPHPMFVDISKTLFIFSWQQPVKRKKKRIYKGLFYCTHKSYFQNES